LCRHCRFKRLKIAGGVVGGGVAIVTRLDRIGKSSEVIGESFVRTEKSFSMINASSVVTYAEGRLLTRLPVICKSYAMIAANFARIVEN
jgi:hypothetical protein